MIRNYFKVAWRNLERNKAFSAINLSGLALGLACSLLITLWIRDERGVDAFHANGKLLYQVYERWFYDGKVEASYPTQGLLAQELKAAVPEIQYASSLDYAAGQGTESTFEASGKVNKMDGRFAGTDFFSMFSYPLLVGQAAHALNAPGRIAVSRKMAEAFFGSPAAAMGKTIRYENKEDLEVTAVFENIPVNSSQQFDFLRTWFDYVAQNKWVNNWGNTSPETYVQLRPGSNALAVEARVKDFIYRFTEKQKGSVTELHLQPYAERYLRGNFKDGYIAGGRIEYVRLFSIVAVVILLIACINFMNLATARSAKRSREVGIRKVIGAVRSALVGQFIGEAVLITFLAIILALAISGIALPAFGRLTGKQLSLPVTEPGFWLFLTCLLAVTSIVAGSYPALFLSALKPIRVLKGVIKTNPSATLFRKLLVVFQFALSIILVVSMIVIYRQVNYVQSLNLGYDRENLIFIPIEGELIKNYNNFKEEASRLTAIQSVSKMRNSPTVIAHHTNSIDWPGKPPELSVSFADAVVGYDFIRTLHIQLAAGRDFSRAFGTDSAAFLLNETAVQKMGLKNPVGQTINWGKHQGKVIGVVSDFHFNSMHETIDPLIIRFDDNWGWGTILVRTTAGKTRQALRSLQDLCGSLNPKFPFTYRFSDQEYAKLYRSEQVVRELAGYFAFLAIFISCLGLFGLAAFTAEQRTKEIGIRKVLGASIAHISGQLSAVFLKPVCIALLVAFPVSWYVMTKWLEDFAYKVSLEWWVFALAGVLTIMIALITVSFQTVRAAMAKPIKSLRSE
jgi:putative ABC transport system permease protein